MNRIMAFICFLALFGLVTKGETLAQDSGHIWIKTFLPGSSNLNDPTIDRKALAFVDSLMQNPALEVQFLGGADPLKWKLLGKSVATPISGAWDAAKKLERAARLRQRYGRGEIGTTDEPIRGVKVVWGPAKPNIFAMAKKMDELEGLLDSLLTQMNTMKSDDEKQLVSLSNWPVQYPEDRITVAATKQSLLSDWEVETGVMVWSAGDPWDLFVPYVGLSLEREKLAIEFQGGFTPWSKRDAAGDRGDAILLGAVDIFPGSWCGFRTGIFSGWEFFSHSDQWTMKVMGITMGPKLKWKFLKTYLGYSYGKISSLTYSDQWQSGGIFAISINLKLH